MSFGVWLYEVLCVTCSIWQPALLCVERQCVAPAGNQNNVLINGTDSKTILAYHCSRTGLSCGTTFPQTVRHPHSYAQMKLSLAHTVLQKVGLSDGNVKHQKSSKYGVPVFKVCLLLGDWNTFCCQVQFSGTILFIPSITLYTALCLSAV